MANNHYSVSKLQTVKQILKETCKLLQRNKTIFLFITLVTIIVSALLLLANLFTLIPLLQKLSRAAIALLQMDPKAPEYIKQLFNVEEKTFLTILVEMFYILLMAMFTLLSLVSAIFVSGTSYLGKDLTIKELCLNIKQIWFRPLITWFYALLMSLGLISIILPEYLFVILERKSLIMLVVGVIFYLLITILSFYLSLIWNVGIVTSVLEGLCGFEALGKAERLICGKKFVGFILVFLLVVPFHVAYYSVILTNSRRPIAIQFLVIFLAMICLILINIWSVMTYTVFYFVGKESQDIGYTEVSATPCV